MSLQTAASADVALLPAADLRIELESAPTDA